MTAFETDLNSALSDTFNTILKYEETCLRSIYKDPITVTEAHLLEVIDKLENPIASEIAKELEISLPTATVALKKLERKGFIERTISENDARKYLIYLTETGYKINKAHIFFHRKLTHNLSRQFYLDEKAVLLVCIKRLNDFFKEKVVNDEF